MNLPFHLIVVLSNALLQKNLGSRQVPHCCWPPRQDQHMSVPVNLMWQLISKACIHVQSDPLPYHNTAHAALHLGWAQEVKPHCFQQVVLRDL